MIKIGEKTKVVIDWVVQPVDYSREKADGIAHKMAKKYGIPKDNIVVEPKFCVKNKNGEDVPLTNELITNIQDPKFQQMMFIKYAEDNGIEEFDADAINDIDNQLNTQIDYEVYDKFKKYEVKWIKWGNFLSYGESNFIDFTKLHGLVHLKGEPANESGKSTLAYDLLHFLLFGKASSEKADVLAKLFNRHIPEATECFVEGCLCIEGQDYVIKRTVTRPKLEKRTDKSKVVQKINYYKITNGVETELDDIDNMEGESGTETNKVIKEAIGNEKDFDLVVSANADNLKSLISLKDTDRGRLLSRWIGLLPLEEKDAKAREMWNHEIVPNLISSKYNREVLKSEIEELEGKKKEDGDTLARREKELEDTINDIATLNNTKEALISAKQPVDSDLLKIDVRTVETKLENITSEGQKKNEELKAKQDRITEIGDIDFSEDDYKAKSKEKSNIEIKQAERRTEIKALKELNKQLEKSEFCPTCGKRFDDVDNTAKIEENKSKIESLTKKGVSDSEKLKEIEAELESMETDRRLFIEKNRLEIQVEAIETNIKNLRLEYKQNRDLKKRFETNKSLIAKNNEIDLSINTTNITISTKENRRGALIREIEGLKRNITDYEREIGEKSELIRKILLEDKKVRDWKIYLRLVGKDGIGKMVLRQALPIINNELSRLLEGVCDFDVEVTIDDYNDVAFNIVRDGIVGNLNSGSGYEKTAASIALRAVLGKISTMPKPSFIVLDEVLGGVAEENYDNIKKLYDRILPDYNFIFHITHLEQLEDWSQQTVLVRKENNISKVIEYGS
jgi:DNA repair exonuclease SbcCD ATPase subunit